MAVQERKSLKFDEGVTARGTETRNTQSSELPFSSMSANAISPQHRAIRKAATNGNAYLYIVDQMAAAVEREASVSPKPWVVGTLGEHLAEIILHPFIYGEPISDSNSAELLGMSKSNYQKTWKRRVMFMREKYKVWAR